MEFINIHSDNDTIVMVMNEEADYGILLDVLRERLTVMKEHDPQSIRKLRFDFGRRDLDASELMLLFDTVTSSGIAVVEGILSQPQIISPIEIYEGSVRSGEHMYFQNSVMVAGDIHPNGTVTARLNVYVVGKIQGKVIIKSENGKVVGSGFRGAVIQIFDSLPQAIERMEAAVIYCENKEIKMNSGFVQRGEIDVTSHRRHIG